MYLHPNLPLFLLVGKFWDGAQGASPVVHTHLESPFPQIGGWIYPVLLFSKSDGMLLLRLGYTKSLTSILFSLAHPLICLEETSCHLVNCPTEVPLGQGTNISGSSPGRPAQSHLSKCGSWSCLVDPSRCLPPQLIPWWEGPAKPSLDSRPTAMSDQMCFKRCCWLLGHWQWIPFLTSYAFASVLNTNPFPFKLFPLLGLFFLPPLPYYFVSQLYLPFEAQLKYLCVH